MHVGVESIDHCINMADKAKAKPGRQVNVTVTCHLILRIQTFFTFFSPSIKSFLDNIYLGQIIYKKDLYKITYFTIIQYTC